MPSVSGRAERLERYMRNKDVYFIGDKNKKIYHNKDCEGIEYIVNKNLCSCGANPENAGFKPCPVCNPVPVIFPPQKSKHKTRKATLQESLLALASRHDLHIEFKGTTAYVTTIAGEWFFTYTDMDSKIQLYHKNNKEYNNNGITHNTGYCHNQKNILILRLACLAT